MTAIDANPIRRPAASATHRPLRIALASMAPFLGGAEVALERMAVGLRDLGHDLLLLLGRTGELHERLRQAGLRCVVTPMYHTDKWRPIRYWRARSRLRQILRRERPDVLLSNDLPTHQILSDAARGLGFPRLCYHRFPFSGPALDWLNKFGAERHLFVSKALMEENCGQSDRLRAAPRAVVYDGLPLPPEPTADERLSARQRLGLPSDRVIVTIAGQVIERKGVADLIRAWPLLPARERAAAELVVVGDDLAGQGAYRREMESLATAVGCPARFVGFQTNVPEWLLATDVAAVPSHVEPLGNATLEAMAYGLPVIGGNVGGIPEMVVHEQTGLLVPPKSPDRLAAALGRLVRNREERPRFGANGRHRCEEIFSLPAHARAVQREYQIALSEGNIVKGL